MFVLGLTGSIGMGKSITAAFFCERGVPVHDSDSAVHALYSGAAVGPVEQAFPGVTRGGVIDREMLGRRVLDDSEAMKRLDPSCILSCAQRARPFSHGQDRPALRLPCSISRFSLRPAASRVATRWSS